MADLSTVRAKIQLALDEADAALATPAPVPAPVLSAAGAYRSSQPYLFTSIQAATIPNRIGGGTAYNMDRVGVQYDYVDETSGWAWVNRGGDWIDRNGAKQGAAAWVDVAATAGDQSTAADYSADCTAALRAVRAGRWNAWIVRGVNAPLVMAGRFGAKPPAIDVKHADGSTATLACRVAALLSSGSAQPSQGGAQYSLPMAVEFERPTKDVASATLRFTITQRWSGSGIPHVLWNLADPPLNSDPVTTGYAQAYTLDSGIEADANTIWVHRYADGTATRDVILQPSDSPLGKINWFDRNYWSPHLWQDGGAVDKTKLPYVGAGKWVGGTKGGAKDNDPNWNVVPSTYTGEGFKPLAPGLGAMRVRMPADTALDGTPIVDGSEVGQNGTLGLNAKLYMPEADIGLLDHAFVRYYVFIAPYAPTLADKKQVLKLGVPTWTDMAGKGLINLSHATPYGGNSASCGGGLGWSARHEFSDNVFDVNSPSPVNGGLSLNFSWYDFQYAGYNASHPYGQPVGYTYGASEPEKAKAPGQRGGIGAELYFGRWYCIEMEWQMNSVDTINPQDNRYWTPNGAMRMWIDGRLCYERANAVFRVLPKVPLDATTQMPPIRKLGIAEVWFNWFHGGLTRNTVDRTVFVAGLVVGRNRIGPMKI